MYICLLIVLQHEVGQALPAGDGEIVGRKCMPISICINNGNRDRLASGLNGKNQERQYRHNIGKGGSIIKNFTVLPL